MHRKHTQDTRDEDDLLFLEIFRRGGEGMGEGGYGGDEGELVGRDVVVLDEL